MATFVILMGAPGAGKGTQAKRLEKALGLPQVASGDLFRANLKNQTELGKLAQTYMDKGELVPDEVTIAMIKDRLSQPDCAKGAILDGFPRTVAQANALDELLRTTFHSRIALVPHIFVEPEVLINRLLKRGEIEARADDNEETIRKRMQVYQEETAPLLGYYRERGLLTKIDGDRPVERVQAELLEKIETAVANL
jgi:adenylate kinase